MPPTAARPASTFRARLAVSMTALALSVLGAASFAIYVGVRHSLLASLDQAVLSIARAEVASAIDEPGQQIHLHEVSPAALALPLGSGYEKFALIKGADRSVIATTANLAGGPALRTDLDAERRALAGTASFADIHRGDAVYRAVYYPLRDVGGTPLLAIVATPKRPVQRSLHTLLAALLIALAVGGGVSAWGAYRLARRLTRPLEQIADAAHAIGEDSLSVRIPAVSPDAELHEVTNVLNGMLARIEAAFLAQRRFISDASHELRSPLANLRGTVEVALRQPRSVEEYRDTLATSLIEIERLSRLVIDLLTLSRADAGQLAIEPARCDLTRIAAAAAHAHTPRAAEQRVGLELRTATPCEVFADSDRLRQVVDNLLDNALRHAPAGSAIVVTTQRDGMRAILAVRDAGPGLSPEDQARVFDRFYRADESRARGSGGLGLGLAIAKAIVEAHKGRLHVASTPGGGATFSIVLPAAAPAD